MSGNIIADSSPPLRAPLTFHILVVARTKHAFLHRPFRVRHEFGVQTPNTVRISRTKETLPMIERGESVRDPFGGYVRFQT